MKRYLCLFAIIFAFLAAYAKTGYKILKMNSTKITYCGKPCRINNVIQRLDRIKWNSPDDALFLQDLATKQFMVWSAKKHTKATKDSNGFTPTGQLSSRNIFSLSDLVAELEDVVLFDKWHAYTPYPTTGDRWFELTFHTPEGIVAHKLPGTPQGEFIIPRSLFADVTDPVVHASIRYVTADGKVVNVSDNVIITLTDSIKK